MAIRVANRGGGGALSNSTFNYWNKQLGGQIANKQTTQQRVQNLAPAGTGTVRKPATNYVQKPASPARNTSRSSGGGSYGGGGSYYGGGGGGVGALNVQSVAPSEEDYLGSDSIYQATISALAKQLSNFNTDIDTQLANRSQDFTTALKQLGYAPPVEEGGQGSWNFEDTMTAAGRAYQAMLNDFAARNMVQSQAYDEAQNDLARSLNDQYEGMLKSNNQFISDMTRQKTKAKDENVAAQQAARAEAILRRAAEYGFGV